MTIGKQVPVTVLLGRAAALLGQPSLGDRPPGSPERKAEEDYARGVTDLVVAVLGRKPEERDAVMRLIRAVGELNEANRDLGVQA